ncbi:MAG: IS30 family transposase [Parcubacteria group bacterium]|nr:IS30 family transposase [Parcubacteria group bacterium]
MQRITFFERQIIESGLRVGKPVRAIAKCLSRDHRVIQREVNRNRMFIRPYSAILAQRLTDQREQKRHQRKLEKLEFQPLRQYVIKQLKEDLSPEQIAGVTTQQPPLELKGQSISHESIYQYVYEGGGRFENLYYHLRRKRKKRQKQRARKPQKIVIPERISIHQRPAEINEKLAFGHWESDTLEGKRSIKEYVSVQYERKSQLARLHKIIDKSAIETEEVIRDSIGSLPQYLWQSITFDNGLEGANHYQLKNDYQLKTYFCDAYAAWQKGGVENLNGLIRQYIPKGSDISKLTEDQIYAIQEKLNNRPRKSLNYLTPNQVIAQETGLGGALET